MWYPAIFAINAATGEIGEPTQIILDGTDGNPYAYADFCYGADYTGGIFRTVCELYLADGDNPDGGRDVWALGKVLTDGTFVIEHAFTEGLGLVFGDIAVHPDTGALYGEDDDVIFTIDLATGARGDLIQLLSEDGTDAKVEIFAMDFDANGQLWAVGGQNISDGWETILFTIDVASGHVSIVNALTYADGGSLWLNGMTVWGAGDTPAPPVEEVPLADKPAAGNEIAATGSEDLGQIGLIAGGALLLGATLMFARRRQKSSSRS